MKTARSDCDSGMESPPPAKRLKRLESLGSDSNDTTTTYMETDDDDWQPSVKQSGKPIGKPDGKMVMKVPRGRYEIVPESVQRPKSKPVVSDKRKRRNMMSNSQFEAMDNMHLNDICVLAEASTEFKEMAQRFFVMKYRNLKLSSLADSITGKYTVYKFRRLLRLFGHLIWSLDLNLDALDKRDSCAELMELIRNQCEKTLGWILF